MRLAETYGQSELFLFIIEGSQEGIRIIFSIMALVMAVMDLITPGGLALGCDSWGFLQ